MDARLADGLGLWFEIFSAGATPGRPGLFLDRDGVIIEETNYLGRAEDVRMIAGTADAVSWANRAGFAAIIITNQAGIGRGYYGWDGFVGVQERIVTDSANAHARIDVLASAFHEQGRGPLAHAGHPWRKPNPGMILAAALALGAPHAADDGRALTGAGSGKLAAPSDILSTCRRTPPRSSSRFTSAYIITSARRWKTGWRDDKRSG